MVNRPWESHIPDALTALLAAVKVESQTWAGGGPEVHFGQFTSQQPDLSVLVVGWTGFVPGYEYPTRVMSEETYSPIVSAVSTQSGLTPSALEEFLINCASLVRTGSNNDDFKLKAVKTAYANLEIVGRILQGPQWLNGTVAKAEMGETSSLNLVGDRRGVLAVVPFSVRCTAWAQQ